MTGNPLFDRILIALNMLALLAAFGMHFYTENMFEKPLPNNEAEFEQLRADSKEFKDVRPIKLDRLVINLSSRTTRLRTLDIEIHILPFKQENASTIMRFKPVLVDIIIQAASEMSPHEINSVSGKILLESRIKERFRQRTGSNVIQKIFFSKFIVA